MSVFLECHNLHYRYLGQEKDTIHALSFSVNRAEFIGILGAEDAGKTTLTKLLKGLLLPSTGHIRLTNIPSSCQAQHVDQATLSSSTAPKDLAQFRQRIGAVFSDPENQIVGTTVEEDLAFGLGNLQLPPHEIRTRVDRYLIQFGLFHCAKRAPHELSGGEQQKLCLAGILAMEPDCLIIDDPLSFLDPKSRGELLQIFRDLNARGTTLLYLSSNPEELLSADRILLLKAGQLHAESSVKRLWQNPQILEQVGILPPDIMEFRHKLRQQGYIIHPESLSPEKLVEDICHQNFELQANTKSAETNSS